MWSLFLSEPIKEVNNLKKTAENKKKKSWSNSFDKLSPALPLEKDSLTGERRLVNFPQTIFLKRLYLPLERAAIIASSLFLTVGGARAVFENRGGGNSPAFQT